MFAAKVGYGRGPVAKHLAMCMPPRASAAAKLGQAGALQQLHPEAQWLKSFEFVAQCHNTYRERRRFFLQDPMGLECLLLDVADPTRTCPSEVPHGPEGRRAAALRALGPDASEEAVEKVMPPTTHTRAHLRAGRKKKGGLPAKGVHRNDKRKASALLASRPLSYN